MRFSNVGAPPTNQRADPLCVIPAEDAGAVAIYSRLLLFWGDSRRLAERGQLFIARRDVIGDINGAGLCARLRQGVCWR